MFHELLLALEGCAGSIFVAKSDTLIVDKSLPFFSAPERNALDDLCRIGGWYRRIQLFTERYESREFSGSGKYLRALCGALGLVTDPYLACLQQLETDLLQDADLGLAYVLQAVQPHSAMLRSVADLLDDVNRLEAYGCCLLDVLHRHVAAAGGGERRQLQLLMQQCHRVLFAQLSAWLLHGLLPDASGEFFLRQREPDTTGASADCTDGAVFAKTAAEHEPPALPEFEINPDMLPSYLPLRLCESILFVGNTIQMCRQRVQWRPAVEGAPTHTDPLLEIVAGKEAELAAEFEQLASQEIFSAFKLEQTVNRIKILVAKHLWQVIVVDADLAEHMHSVKTFSMLGSGTLFQELFTECDHILSGTPKVSNIDLSEALAVACGRAGLEEEAVLERVRLVLAPEPATPGKPCATGWDRLRIHYNLKWPLHLLYTPAVLAQLNEIFSFLLQVKLTQILLERLWAEQMTEGRQEPRTPAQAAAHQLRAHMAFLVHNLQYYLHVDVLEAEYARLQAGVAAAEDYEQLCHAHDCFLNAVSSQCFLQSRPVMECLRDLLAACRELCGAVGCRGEQLQQLQQRLQRKSQLLFRILSSVKDQRARNHLSRLLLRVDFNHFISKML